MAPLLSVVVTIGFFLTIVVFVVLKDQLETTAFPELPPPEARTALSPEQIAALVRPASDFVIQIINILIGALTAAFATVISFWLGSSQGSRVKDQQIAKTSEVAVQTAQTAANTAERGRNTAVDQRNEIIESVLTLEGRATESLKSSLGEAVAQGAASPGVEHRPEPPSPLSANALEASIPGLVAPHKHFPDGVSWALTTGGISIDGAPPERTQGSPSTITRIWTNYGRFCAEAATQLGVPVELIVATIATESRGDPNARRSEPSVRDESVGLMQTLVRTAREATGNLTLKGDELLDPETSIKVGTAYIAQQRRSTRSDPPLVAAAYNAGSLKRDDAPANRWRLHCFPKGTGRHIDNFVAWFGDAMVVSGRDDWSRGGTVPSFAHALGDGSPGTGDGAGPAGTGGGRVTAFEGGPAGFPAHPSFAPIVSVDDKNQVFGEFRFRGAPVAGNPENIEILDDWTENNIVTVNLPVSRDLAADGTLNVRFNKRCASQLRALFDEWRDSGLVDRIISYDGAFVPRFQRGSTTTLSNHSWGTAIDINAAFNPLGREPASAGKRGCVYDLVPAALRHGFYWGGHFRQRKDGMHFEIAKVMA